MIELALKQNNLPLARKRMSEAIQPDYVEPNMQHIRNRYLQHYFEDIYNNRNEQYANGRDVRNYFEKVYSAQADRLANINNPSYEELQTFTVEDLIKGK